MNLRIATVIAARILIALLLLVAAYLALSPTGRYVVRAAWTEAQILRRRRPIAEMVKNRATSPAIRSKLRLVLDARAFAAESVGLKAKESFTAYTQLQTDTLVLVLSAAYRDQLKSYTWWFPVVGRVPYKGYFEFAAARAAARQMDADGFDVYLRPSPAFSTLGWFNDPLLSTSLNADSIDLANTVIHELTHNTFWASGQVSFNESFANFVGARGASWFYRTRGEPHVAEEQDARWDDDKILARFWAKLYHSIDSAFAAHPNSAADRIAARDTIYAEARTELTETLGPRFHTIGPRVLQRMRLDNAALLAHRIYLTDIDLFERVWAAQHGDLRRTVQRIIELAKSRPNDPFGALRDAK